MEHGYWSASASLMLSCKHIIKRRLSESITRGAFSRLKGVQVCCFKIQSSPSEICLLQGRETWSGTKLKSRFLRQQKPAPISPPVSVSIEWSMQPPAQILEPLTWNSAAIIASFQTCAMLFIQVLWHFVFSLRLWTVFAGCSKAFFGLRKHLLSCWGTSVIGVSLWCGFVYVCIQTEVEIQQK